jgi:zinc D-Ala-D-Ala carboxypeptidase
MSFDPMKYRLTPHFVLGEFLVSATAARRGRVVEVLPGKDQEIIDNLQSLCAVILEPLRTHFKKPVTIISGYRPEWLNKMVGGSKTSDHMTGCAADLYISGVANKDICHAAQKLDLPFKQCINEFPPGGWVHISHVRGTESKQQMLTALKQGGKTIYLGGILS